MFLKLIKDPLNFVFFLVGLVAVGLYIFCFSVNREFWLDEAFLGLNILDRSYFDLWFPLDFKQVAPPLFLMLGKFIYNLPTGLSIEQSLRLYSLLCGIGSVLLFPLVAGKFIKNRLILLIIFILFCFNPRIVYYTQEFKQYGPDVFWGLLLTYIFSRLKIEKIRPIRLFYYGLLMGCLLFLSHTTIFFVTAGFAILFFDKCISFRPFKINKMPFFKLFYMGLGYLIPFLLLLFFDCLNTHHDYMYLWWKNRGSFLEKDFSNIFVLFYSFLESFFFGRWHLYPTVSRFIMFDIPLILFTIILICPSRYMEKKMTYISFLLLEMLVASYLNFYPLYERTVLYFLPFFLIIFGVGADSSLKVIRELSGLFLLFFLFTTGIACFAFTQDYANIELSPIHSAIKELKKEKETIPLFFNVEIFFPQIPNNPDHGAVFIFYKKHLNYFPIDEVRYDTIKDKKKVSLNCIDYFSKGLESGKKYALIWEKGIIGGFEGEGGKIPTDCLVQFGAKSQFKKKGEHLYFWTQP